MEVCVLGMEGVRRDAESNVSDRMAPYVNKSPKKKTISHDACNGKILCGPLNGRRLKVNVERLNTLNTSHISKKSSSLSETKKRNRKNSEKCVSHKDCFSNNNTIKNGMTVIEPNRIDVTPVESCRIGEPSLSDHLCSNCTTVADSPQSIISEESLSQASDCVIISDGRLLQRSNSVSSIHSLDSQQSQKTVAPLEPPPPCRWAECTEPQVDLSRLHDHIKTKHIEPQEGKGKYVCQWEGCRCYDKPSWKRSWLERHVLTHTGDKPHKCIIDGCGLRFSSKCMLERHVRQHFLYQEQLESAKANGNNGSPTKGNRKRKLKRKIVRPVKTQDFFDAAVMQEIKARLCHVTSQNAQASAVPQFSLHTATSGPFQTSVIARRQEPDGTTRVLRHPLSSRRCRDVWTASSSQAASQQQ